MQMPPMREVLAGLSFLAAILCAMCALIYCGVWAAAKLERAALRKDAEEAERFDAEFREASEWDAPERWEAAQRAERSEAKR